jgi:hypothetical protein
MMVGNEKSAAKNCASSNKSSRTVCNSPQIQPIHPSIDPFKRIQKSRDFPLEVLFPIKNDGFCDCGCGEKLSGRQSRWRKGHSDMAVLFWRVMKGDSKAIRYLLQERDGGKCKGCGRITEDWDADHIIEVVNGGGGCDLSNFQTLCKRCHKDKTRSLWGLPPKNQPNENQLELFELNKAHVHQITIQWIKNRS